MSIFPLSFLMFHNAPSLIFDVLLEALHPVYGVLLALLPTEERPVAKVPFGLVGLHGEGGASHGQGVRVEDGGVDAERV